MAEQAISLGSADTLWATAIFFALDGKEPEKHNGLRHLPRAPSHVDDVPTEWKEGYPRSRKKRSGRGSPDSFEFGSRIQPSGPC